MRIAHISDLHISRLGARLSQRRSAAKEVDSEGWQNIHELDGWRVQKLRAEGRTFRRYDMFRLVDDCDIVHETNKVKGIDTTFCKGCMRCVTTCPEHKKGKALRFPAEMEV